MMIRAGDRSRETLLPRRALTRHRYSLSESGMAKRSAQLLHRHSRSSIVDKLFTKSANHFRNQELLHNLKSNFGFATVSHNVSESASKMNRVWAEFTIYKGKAALSFSPLLPKFEKSESHGVYLAKKGAILLKFSPAIPGQQQKYDWGKKQLFALSATEVGSLISLAPNESCEFFHDPSMKTSLAGQVRKSLTVSPNADNSAYFFNLNVVDQIQKINERLNLPVSKAEFSVMRTAFSYVLPHIMGWNRLTYSYPKASDRGVQRLEVPPSPDTEWGR